MATSKAKFKTLDAYINSFPEEVQRILQTVRQTVKAAAPKAEETITYDMPTFKHNGKSFVLFAAWKKHLAFYGFSSTVLNAFEKELAAYKTEKGTLQFPLNEALPLALIRKLVKLRLKEIKADD